jgi:hypothetical protein
MKHYEIVHEQLQFSRRISSIYNFEQKISINLSPICIRKFINEIQWKKIFQSKQKLHFRRILIDVFTELFRIELHYHRIEHDIYKRLIEQLHQLNIYDNHELILVVPILKLQKKDNSF